MLAPPGVFPEPIRWLEGVVSGDVDIRARTLALDRLELAVPGARADFTGAIALTPTEVGLLPSIRLAGPIDGVLGKQDVLNYWPVDFALGARDWIRDNVVDGRLFDARLRLDIDAEDLVERMLENDDLSLTFRFEDADVRYVSTMTPLEGLDGRGELLGNAFVLAGQDAAIGALVVDTIFVDIPRLNPKGALARFGGTGRGSAPDFLRLINEPPLGVADAYGLDPDAFAGRGEVSFAIERPMRRHVDPDRLGYDVSARFTDVTSPSGVPGVAVTDGALELEVTEAGLIGRGEGRLADTRAQILWNETFGGGPEAQSTTIQVSAVMNGRDLDRLGLPLRNFLDGAVGVQAEVAGRGFDFSSVQAALDLEHAAVAFPAGLWEKPAGAPAVARFTAAYDDEGALSLESVELEGPGVALEASARLGPDGRLLSGEARRLFVDGRLDLAAAAERPDGADGALRLRVTGPFLDAQDLFSLAAPEGGGGFAGPFSVEGALDTVLVRGVRFEDVDFAFEADAQGVERALLAAKGRRGATEVRFEPVETGAEAPRRLSVRSADAGVLLAAFGGYDNAAGGVLELNAAAPPAGQPGGLAGTIEVEDFTLNRMPLLARILGAGSLEGIADLLGGGGIDFERLESGFVWDRGVLEMREARVAGPSLGATWSGLVDFNETRLGLDGALLPSYGINSVLGSVPLVGELLTSRRGEGVIGLTFSVSGSFDETRVQTNPLSALAPGVFRRIFEGTSAERELEALEARRRAQAADAEAGGRAPDPGEGAP